MDERDSLLKAAWASWEHKALVFLCPAYICIDRNLATRRNTTCVRLNTKCSGMDSSVAIEERVSMLELLERSSRMWGHRVIWMPVG